MPHERPIGELLIQKLVEEGRDLGGVYRLIEIGRDPGEVDSLAEVWCCAHPVQLADAGV
jgi:hypothetical protein